MPASRSERIAALEAAIYGARAAAARDRIASVRRDRALHRIDRARRVEFNPDQRRDYHGRWTDGNGTPTDQPPAPTPLSSDEVAAFAGGSAEQHLVTDETGTHFTPERQALHDQIIGDMLDGHPEQEHPRYNLMGGGPASGKSTMMDSLTPETGVAAIVNADDVKLRLPEYASRGADAAAFTHEESSYVTRRAIGEAFNRRINVTLDGTGDSSASSLTGKINEARRAGYSVHGYYVTVPTETAVHRAQLRGERTGRYVPRAVIEGTHRSVSQTLPKVADRFDTLRVYDNTHKLTPILEKKQRGRPRVLNQELWQAFLDKANS